MNQPTQQEMNTAMALLCEPDDAEKRRDLMAFLDGGGTIKAGTTERGERTRRLLRHKYEHEGCGEACEERKKLAAERDALTGPDVSYKRMSEDDIRAEKEHQALVVLWCIEAVTRLRDRKLLETNFLIENVTEAGREQLGAFKPERAEARAVFAAFFGGADDKKLDDIVLLAFDSKG